MHADLGKGHYSYEQHVLITNGTSRLLVDVQVAASQGSDVGVAGVVVNEEGIG